MDTCLIIEHGDGRKQVVDLSADHAATLGRSRKNTVLINDRHASRKHAEITYRDGQWRLRDCETLNGTYLQEDRLQDETILAHDQTIRIGATRIRFCCEQDSNESTLPFQTVSENAEDDRPFDRISPASEPELSAGDLSTLFRFVSGSVEETSHLALVRRALEILQTETGAAAVGFLSFDPYAPVPRLVLPDNRSLNMPLSRQLTQWAQDSGATAWLSRRGNGTAVSESMVACSDAICVPLGTRGAPLGVVHAYGRQTEFTPRQVHFAEMLADFLGKRLKQINAQRRLRSENSRFRSQSRFQDNFICESPAMRSLVDKVDCLARSRCKVILICGESGSGKEHVAAILHERSPRRENPFIPVNCATIPDNLADAHLFGHERGAFTGADRTHAGYFREADDGTLFLDEIGELPLECQAKLLRVIEGKGFRPVGGRADVFVDVRIVAATNRNLKDLAKVDKFREDLLFRFEMTLEVPPLREREEDIGSLARYFVARLAADHGRDVELSDAAIARLKGFSWPGNVRQLRSVLARAVILGEGDSIDADDIDLPCQPAHDSSRPASLKLDDLEAWAIGKALKQTSWNQTEAAAVLGVNRDTLRAKIKKYGIEREE
jgi:Nif-specific regulatory protein